jgi:hypothetical protein
MPRFLPVIGRRVDEVMVPTWPGGGRLLATDSVPSSWIAWRLLGSNHRELARSAAVFPDVQACELHIRRVQEALSAGPVEVHTHPSDGLWTWVMSLPGEAGVVSSRQYQRQYECTHSWQLFAASAESARLATNLASFADDLPSAAAG